MYFQFLSSLLHDKKKTWNPPVRTGGTGIPEKRNKASPRLYGMSIAQFPRFSQITSFPVRGLCERYVNMSLRTSPHVF